MNVSQSYGVSSSIWDHTVLPATQHRWTLTPAKQAGTWFTYHTGMEGWVGLDGLVKNQDGICMNGHPSRTIPAWHRVTLLMGTTMLPLSQTTNFVIFHAFAEKLPWADLHEIWYRDHLMDTVNCVKFVGNRLTGSWFCGVKFCPFPFT